MVTDADILELVKTKPDAMQLQKDLTASIDALFSNRSLEDVFNDYIAYDKKEKLVSLMKMHNIALQNTSQVQQFLQQLDSRLQEVAIISITLAFPPKQQLITSLSAWFVVHAKKAILLDIFVDKTLIGGAIIAYNGTYKDYSVKRTL